MTEHEISREDSEALLETRRELGVTYDAALVDSFADRVEKAIAERVDEQIAVRRARQKAVAGAGGRQLALGIVSAVAAIPISIVLGVTGNPVALLMALMALVVVNVAHAWQSRLRD